MMMMMIVPLAIKILSWVHISDNVNDTSTNTINDTNSSLFIIIITTITTTTTLTTTLTTTTTIIARKTTTNILVTLPNLANGFREFEPFH